MLAEHDKAALKATMPEVLRYYGINPSRDFRVPWRDDDTNPSGHYSTESNLVTDFGRNERIDVFELVGRMEGIESFPDKVRRVSEIVGMPLVDGTDSIPTSPRPKVERPRFELPAKAGFEPTPIEVFESMRAELFKNEAALSYLLSRGFDRPKVWRNCLGWVPSIKTLVNDDGSKMFTMYEPNAQRGFIVIPFMNRDATAASYAMLRTIPADKPPQNKEIRPTGCKSPLYREWLLSANCTVLFITEGLLDALSLEMLIGKPCLGLGGTNFTKRLASVLYATPEHQRPKKIVLALDADAPGRESSDKIAADLDALNIPHANMTMPQGCKDPNDILMQLGGD